MSDYQLLWLSLCLIVSAFLVLAPQCRRRGSALLNASMTLMALAYQGFFLVAHYFTRNGIDDSVIYHLKYGLEGAGYGEYGLLISLTLFGLLLSFGTTYWVGRWVTRHMVAPRGSRRSVVVACGLFVGAFVFSPTSADLWRYADSFIAPPPEPRRPFTDYYVRDQVRSAGGPHRNLLYIYAESLERTYFDETVFPGLIERLRRLETIGTTFTGIEQAQRTGWTIGGITASQCGIPLVTPSHGNSMSGMDAFLPNARCLGDDLSAAGYELSTMIGSSMEFSGLGKFFHTHGFTHVRGGPGDLVEALDDPAYTNGWGLYDDSLFAFAMDELDRLAARDEPYALFLSTMDTHHPRGHPSGACDGLVYGDGDNPILNAVACSDRLIGEFVEDVLASEHADQLVIVISSDHLAMRNTASDLLEQAGDRRNLLLVIDPDREARVVSGRGSMLDVASTVLPFLGFTGNVGLGRDLLRERSLLAAVPDFDALLAAWDRDMMALWRFPRIELGDPLLVDLQKNVVSVRGRRFKFPLLIEVDPRGESVLRFHFGASSGDAELFQHLLRLEKGRPFLWIDSCEVMTAGESPGPASYCLMYGRASTGHTRFLPIEEDISLLGAELRQPGQGFSPETEQEVTARARDPKRFIAHAGGALDGHTYTNCLEALDLSYRRGFRLFELDIITTADGRYVAAHDWKQWRGQTGFGGQLPPTRAEFLAHPILQRYTPLDMERINRWFATHPDAILVTDKVNEPARFSSRFIDKSRLMMELFSLEALEEGLGAGIASPMPNWALLSEPDGLSPARLHELGVTAVAASRRVIDTDLPLLGELAANDIAVYVYHVNFDEGRDEAFVVCRDMNFVHGLYADNYDLGRPVACPGYSPGGETIPRRPVGDATIVSTSADSGGSLTIPASGR